MRRIFAYLVGIDRYAGNVAQLHGCVNDVEAFASLLRKRATAAGDELTVTLLTNEAATRSGFVEGFRAFFAECRDGDTALLYCSMHGSQEKAAPEFLPFEPDGLNETLVFTDSRSATGRDLADKELSVLVDEVARRGPHVAIVLDCCHSGSGVRGIAAEVGVRHAPTDLRTRSVTDYLPGTLRQAQQAMSADHGVRYVLLAACQSDQSAKETPVGGVQRGALSAALESVLASTIGAISYLQVHRAVSARVRGQVTNQTPQLQSTVGSDVDLLFLDGAASPTQPQFTVSKIGTTWQLDAGLVHGIPASATGDGGVRLALFPLTATDPPADASLATVVTTTVHSSFSEVRFEPAADEARVAAGQTYLATVVHWPKPLVRVGVGADVPDRAALVAAIDAVPGVVVGDDACDLRVEVLGGRIRLLRPDSERAVVAEQDGAAFDRSRLLVEIAQVGRWLALWRLDNPASRFETGAILLEVIDPVGAALPVIDGGVQFSYSTDADGAPVQPRMRLRVGNRSGRTVHVALLDLTELYGINVVDVEGGGLLDPPAPGGATGETFAIASDGTHDLYLSVPDGALRVTDLVKLVVSTSAFDALSWRQQNLRPPSRDRGPMAEVRDISGAPERPTSGEDWTVREVLITTTRPAAGVTLSGGTGALELAPGVRIERHPGLSATVRLAAGVDAGRDALVPLLPSVFAQDPANEPFALLPTRSLGADVDVLEVSFGDSERSTASAVDRDNPLRLSVDLPLDDAEVILPIVFDGTDYLPVGMGHGVDGRTEIAIERLPVSDVGLRSMGGSLKILFRKLVLRRLGVAYDWPRLSLVSYETATPVYDHDAQRVRAALEGKHSILLLVHGIIGDTVGMSAAAGYGSAPIKDRYDAVLAFDYENLNTALEQSARDLGGRLRDVGIEPGGPQRITAVVHSMGGLVSRSFVEQDGGAPMIDRLVTCGTPHAGSPWPRVEDIALALIGLGLNGVLQFGGPLAVAGRVFGYLTKLVEKIDGALDEMTPGSAFLTALAADPDPGLHYVAIRGQRPWPDPADDARAKRIIAKIITLGFDALFAGEPNDMAVSVSSASSVGATWAHPPVLLDADCNHISYFSSPQGLAAITAALSQPR